MCKILRINPPAAHGDNSTAQHVCLTTQSQSTLPQLKNSYTHIYTKRLACMFHRLQKSLQRGKINCMRPS